MSTTTTITRGPTIADGARVTWVKEGKRFFGIFRNYTGVGVEPYAFCRVVPDGTRVSGTYEILHTSEVREATYTEEMFIVLKQDRKIFREVHKVLAEIPLSAHEHVSLALRKIEGRLKEINELLHDGQ